MSALRSAGMLAALFVAIAPSARAQTTTLISAGFLGTQSNAGSGIQHVTPDGRYIVYYSMASNLVQNDTNLWWDVFLYDRVTRSNEIVSLADSGAQSNGSSGFPSVSADGRYVAFQSNGTNVVPGGPTGGVAAGVTDVFLRDRVTGRTEFVSIGLHGAQPDDGSSNPWISADGRYVAFSSFATNIVAGDTNGVADVFVRDRQTRTTECVSRSPSGVQANDNCLPPVMSPDGRFVAFASRASTLVPGDNNNNYDIFLHDRQTGTTQIASVDANGAPGNGPSYGPSISADGRYVAFASWASNLVPGDVNAYYDVFVRDMVQSKTEIVSLSTQGVRGNGHSQAPSISADGRYVVFASESTTFSPLDTTSFNDIYVRDRLLGTTELISTTYDGAQSDGGGNQPSISADGRFITYSTDATNVIPGDTNGFEDVVLFDRDGIPAVPFCSGDGSGTPCPCGNAGAPGNGCANSSSTSGAVLAASGHPHTHADTLVLAASGMPNGSSLFIQGTTRTNGGAGVTFGDGLRCVSGPLIRLGVHANVIGTAQHPGSADPSVSTNGLAQPGDVRTYQVWYRNSASFCTSSAFNLTNGLEITWTF